MKKIKVGIQNGEMGDRGGINTYSSRLTKYLNKLPNVEAYMFIEVPKKGTDIINIQYEPGCTPPINFGDNRVSVPDILNKVKCPVVATIHHTNGFNHLAENIDGFIFHSPEQLGITGEPLSYTVIPHPSLVFPKKDKMELRKKYYLPEDKKIIGTAGFIAGAVKNIPFIVDRFLDKLNDDEMLYLMTSYWKGGDLGREKQIRDIVEQKGKEDQFRMDTDFVMDEKFNEKMQCCDILFGWTTGGQNDVGLQSGSGADMYGSGVKFICKDVQRYSYLHQQPGVVKGSSVPDEFVQQTLDTLRSEEVNNIQDPTKNSWEVLVKNYANYYADVLGL